MPWYLLLEFLWQTPPYMGKTLLKSEKNIFQISLKKGPPPDSTFWNICNCLLNSFRAKKLLCYIWFGYIDLWASEQNVEVGDEWSGHTLHCSDYSNTCGAKNLVTCCPIMSTRWWKKSWTCSPPPETAAMREGRPGWQKLHESTGGICQKVWTPTKILSPNICYLVAN